MIDYSTPTVEQEMIRLRAENASLRALLNKRAADPCQDLLRIIEKRALVMTDDQYLDACHEVSDMMTERQKQNAKDRQPKENNCGLDVARLEAAINSFESGCTCGETGARHCPAHNEGETC